MRQLKLLLLSMFMCGSAAAGVAAGDVVDKDGLRMFVQDAKAYLERDYDMAIMDFRNDKQWREGSTYLFILDKNGFNLFHPVKPSLEGQDLSDLTDVNGVKIVQGLLAAAMNGGGFVEYMWDDPDREGDEETGSPKISYAEMFTKMDGTELVIGSGIYPKN